MPRDQIFQLVGQVRTPGRLSFGEAHFRSIVGMRKMIDGRHHERGEHGAVVWKTAHRGATDLDCRYTALAADQACAATLKHHGCDAGDREPSMLFPRDSEPELVKTRDSTREGPSA